jgi:hypothetical protein
VFIGYSLHRVLHELSVNLALFKSSVALKYLLAAGSQAVQIILLLSCFGGKINRKRASGHKNTKGVVAVVSMVYAINRSASHREGGLHA